MIAETPEERMHAAVGRIPSAVAILTATHQGRSTGMLASWVQQASFEPLRVTVCVKKGRPIEGLIDGSGKFLLNILGEDSKDMFKHFGRGFGLHDDAFEALAVRQRETGVLIVSAIAHVGCEVVAKWDAGDHQLYLGEVIAGDAEADGRPHVHLRKSGQSY